jgi:uracil-DNA glycosylase
VAACATLPAMDELLDLLAGARIGATFNPYGEDGPGALPGAAVVRLANLRRYLGERRRADVVCVGEAGGYAGLRFSGVPFASERDLLAWGPPYRTTSTRPEGWCEASATIVRRTLARLGAERRVLFWNAVPTHPHRPDEPFSNRRPTRAEIVGGAESGRLLLALVRPRRVVAVGRVAEAALPAGTRYLRHPAHGGAVRFADDLAAVLAEV